MPTEEISLVRIFLRLYPGTKKSSLILLGTLSQDRKRHAAVRRDRRAADAVIEQVRGCRGGCRGRTRRWEDARGQEGQQRSKSES